MLENEEVSFEEVGECENEYRVAEASYDFFFSLIMRLYTKTKIKEKNI